MKKSLLALAVLAASGAAFAQSSVTLSGQVNFGYQQYSTAGSAAKPATSTALEVPAVAKGSQKGFALDTVSISLAAVEDLGGGLKANAKVTLDGASSEFANALNRRNTTIGLSGGFGEIALTNTRSGDLMTNAMVAPSNLPDGMYDTSGILARAPVDVLSYMSPSFSGFQAGVGFVEFAKDGNTTAVNNTLVIGGQYAAGPIVAGLAYKIPTKVAAGAAKVKNLEAFATYDLKVVKLGVGFDQKPTGGDHAYAIGVSAPVGPAVLGLNFAKRGANKVTELVAKYNMSKRTNINMSYGKQTVDLGNQYRLSLQHNF